jgi:hydrogenase/urease accessory protein HupE
MDDFNLYFRLGTEHILTWEALDHILFVAALCLRYLLPDWKKVIILVTAFTVGHSITLALSAMGLVRVPTAWIEFLIPLTIVATALNNLLLKKDHVASPSRMPLIYFFALFFGLIHGLAYANTFLSLEGRNGLVGHLLAFNLGIEVAQILIVVVVLLLSYVIVTRLHFSRIWWVRILSILILAVSLKMAFERFPK